MNKQVVLAALALCGLPMLVHASCDTVKAQIDAGIKTKSIPSYTLAVIPADQTPQTGTVVGHCEGNKQIIYTRGVASATDKSSRPSDSSAMPPSDKGSMSEGKTHQVQPPVSSSSS